MKRLALSFASVAALSVVGLIALAPTPAAAQANGTRGPGPSGYEALGNPADVGIMATTPSRIRGSRREMNRGRSTAFEVRMSPREARVFAEDLVGRAQIQCDVADAMVVARTPENIPVLEVDCGRSGGLVIADTLPIQATDCLDFAPPEDPGDRQVLAACQLPGNVARVNAARQSARN